MVLYQKKKRVKPFWGPDEKTLLYGPFRASNGQSKNKTVIKSHPEFSSGSTNCVVSFFCYF